MLSCIAVVAIATFVGTKTLKSNAHEENSLLAQNVEALSDVEAIMGREATPSTTNCYVYKGGKLVTGKKAVCEKAANINVACVKDVCIVANI